jgi:large subunit ribosomal protein L4
VGEIRNPLWRKGGTVFGPQPRSYAFAIPKKVERGALRAALAQKVKDGRLIVVESLAVAEAKTTAAAAMLKQMGVEGKVLLIDVRSDEQLARSVRNIPGVTLLASRQVRAREVADAARLVATPGALEQLQKTLAM